MQLSHGKTSFAMLYGEGFRVIVSLIDEREQPPIVYRQNVIDMGYSAL